MSQPGFWDNQIRATDVSQRMGSLEDLVTRWRSVKKELDDTVELLELDEHDQTVNLHDEIAAAVKRIDRELTQLEVNLLLSGPHDRAAVIMSIHAGSGGTDAQDWAEMLLRMYLRFCEKQGWKTAIIAISPGQEAGIKSVTVEVRGEFAYGYLKAEHGVHRLVRISPFDAEKMRHTSFALVDVLPLQETAITVDIDPDDLRVDTYRSGGHGGQSVNKTDSAVRLTHIPTGIVVACQNERSQQQNRAKAMAILQSKLQQYYQSEREEERQRLRGEFTEASWGNQARSYVLHPYQVVKDHRTGLETDRVNEVLDGDILAFIEASLRQATTKE
jgi:peptide chain release factor 2